MGKVVAAATGVAAGLVVGLVEAAVLGRALGDDVALTPGEGEVTTMFVVCSTGQPVRTSRPASAARGRRRVRKFIFFSVILSLRRTLSRQAAFYY